jgi:hypothetical protein
MSLYLFTIPRSTRQIFMKFGTAAVLYKLSCEFQFDLPENWITIPHYFTFSFDKSINIQLKCLLIWNSENFERRPNSRLQPLTITLHEYYKHVIRFIQSSTSQNFSRHRFVVQSCDDVARCKDTHLTTGPCCGTPNMRYYYCNDTIGVRLVSYNKYLDRTWIQRSIYKLYLCGVHPVALLTYTI